jgi:hypothetical protein
MNQPHISYSTVRLYLNCDFIKCIITEPDDYTYPMRCFGLFNGHPQAILTILTYSVALVCKRTIPNERPPLGGAKLVQTSADRGCYVVSVTDPYGRILGFLDRTCCVNHIANTHYAPITTTPPIRTKYSHKILH